MAEAHAYADEAEINPVPVSATPWLLQIEWTAKSETPITIFRVQFMAVDSLDWSEVDVTSTQLRSSPGTGVWHGTAELENLSPNTQYMVQVSSLNKEGYSKFSGITFFSTPREENYQHEAISTTNLGSRTVLSPFFNFILIAVLVIV